MFIIIPTYFQIILISEEKSRFLLNQNLSDFWRLHPFEQRIHQ